MLQFAQRIKTIEPIKNKEELTKTVPEEAQTSDFLNKLYFFYFIIIFFLFVVDFVIHWNETAMGLHVFPIQIPPPTSLSTRSP